MNKKCLQVAGGVRKQSFGLMCSADATRQAATSSQHLAVPTSV
jgi:hypothetical protein